jgi:hypothetical protein
MQDTSAASNELVEYEMLFFLATAPSKQSGVATTIIGPPTSGTWQVKDRWVDANGALFVCATRARLARGRKLRPALMSVGRSRERNVSDELSDLSDGFAA